MKDNEILKPKGYAEYLKCHRNNPQKETRDFETLVYDISYEILQNAFIGDVNDTCHELKDFEQGSDYWDMCLEQSKKIVKDELKGFLVISGEKIN